jgi:hypothetical protein
MVAKWYGAVGGEVVNDADAWQMAQIRQKARAACAPLFRERMRREETRSDQQEVRPSWILILAGLHLAVAVAWARCDSRVGENLGNARLECHFSDEMSRGGRWLPTDGVVW